MDRAEETLYLTIKSTDLPGGPPPTGYDALSVDSKCGKIYVPKIGDDLVELNPGRLYVHSSMDLRRIPAEAG